VGTAVSANFENAFAKVEGRRTGRDSPTLTEESLAVGPEDSLLLPAGATIQASLVREIVVEVQRKKGERSFRGWS